MSIIGMLLTARVRNSSQLGLRQKRDFFYITGKFLRINPAQWIQVLNESQNLPPPDFPLCFPHFQINSSHKETDVNTGRFNLKFSNWLRLLEPCCRKISHKLSQSLGKDSQLPGLDNRLSGKPSLPLSEITKNKDNMANFV